MEVADTVKIEKHTKKNKSTRKIADTEKYYK